MEKRILSFRRWSLLILIGGVSLLFFVLCMSLAGSPWIFPTDLLQNREPLLQELFYNIRLPRVLLGACVGAGLSASGVAFQSLLRNPLADPYILGVSGGAALGGVIALALGLPFQFVLVMAFAFGLGAMFLIYGIARVEGRLPVYSLLLTGVIFNSFAFALILLINSLVSQGRMQQIVFLLMGSLDVIQYSHLVWVAFFTLAGLIILMLFSSKMNLMTLGEESALHLGLNVEKYRKVIFFAASLAVGACVAVAGLIGFVGLFVPHMVRLCFGSDHRVLIPMSIFFGGIFLIVCDALAKYLLSASSLQTQLPVGVITALIGGPFFVYLLKRKN